MTNKFGKYSAINCQLSPGNLIVDFFCCILWDLFPLLSENTFSLTTNLFSYFNKNLKGKVQQSVN